MNKLFCRVLAAVSLVTVSAAGVAETPPEAQTCVQCHGPEGRSTNPLWPNLAGQHKQYLIKQLQAFRGGARDNPDMEPFVGDLSDEQIAALASYYSALPRGTAASGDAALVTKGRNLAGFCSACHGMTGEPVANEWPIIAGQQGPYLLAQLKVYKSGKRVHPLMQAALAKHSDSELEALAAFYSQFSPD